jgi:hypothetical protein
METHEKIIFFLISFVVGCAVVWGVGAFITFDMLWFIHGWFGRLIAIIFLFLIIGGAAKSVEDS